MQAQVATYTVINNGSAYQAEIQLQNADGYEFYTTGILGERTPVMVRDIRLSGPCNPCNYTTSGAAGISFPLGNYTLTYQGDISESHLTGTFATPYRVEVVLPPGLDARNPLLGMISPGGEAVNGTNGTVLVTWEDTRTFELRIYDPQREELLYFFLNFWILIAIVMLLPFALTWRKKRSNGP